MAKSAQQLVEEARKKNAAQEAAKQQDTSALDELLSGIASEEAPEAPVFEQPVPVVTEVPETAPVTGVTTIEDAVFVPPVQDYAADANIGQPQPDPAPAKQSDPEPAEERKPVYDKATLAEIEAGRKALEKYK